MIPDVTIPEGSTVLGSIVVQYPSGVEQRVVEIELPGMGTVKLRAPVDVAPQLSAAFAGRPAIPAEWARDVVTCTRCGVEDPDCMVSTTAGYACHPQCPPVTPGALYRVECAAEFGTDLVIEVPADVTGPTAVATFLAHRTSLLIRHQIGGEYAVDVMADLDGAFVSVSWDHGRHGRLTQRFDLIEVPPRLTIVPPVQPADPCDPADDPTPAATGGAR